MKTYILIIDITLQLVRDNFLITKMHVNRL